MFYRRACDILILFMNITRNLKANGLLYSCLLVLPSMSTSPSCLFMDCSICWTVVPISPPLPLPLHPLPLRHKVLLGTLYKQTSLYKVLSTQWQLKNEKKILLPIWMLYSTCKSPVLHNNILRQHMRRRGEAGLYLRLVALSACRKVLND